MVVIAELHLLLLEQVVFIFRIVNFGLETRLLGLVSIVRFVAQLLLVVLHVVMERVGDQVYLHLGPVFLDDIARWKHELLLYRLN